jgi:hypothetical protein
LERVLVIQKEQLQEKQRNTMKKIKLSLAAARYLWPVYLDPYSMGKDMFAQKILGKMMKGR